MRFCAYFFLSFFFILCKKAHKRKKTKDERKRSECRFFTSIQSCVVLLGSMMDEYHTGSGMSYDIQMY